MKGTGTLGLGDGHWKARLRGRVSESEVWSVHTHSLVTNVWIHLLSREVTVAFCTMRVVG